MTDRKSSDGRKGLRRSYSPYPCGTAALALLLLAAPFLSAQDQQDSKDQDSIGFSLGKAANAKDVGLPWYPGAQRHKDDPKDSSSVQMSFNSGSTAFKLVVLKLDSSDSSQKVTAFYRQALAKYGKVLECTAANRPAKKDEDGKSSKKLECDSDDAKNGGLVLKAGTPQEQHLVGVDPNGSGSTIQLVFVKLPKDVNKD